MFFPIALILVGALLLLDALGLISISFGTVILPVILVAVGLSMLVKKRRF